jgi:TPR repeat protein
VEALVHDQQIDPATSSEYLERQLTERKVQVEHRYNKQWSVDQTTEPEQVEQLRQMAEDGDAEAALRLALVLDAGVGGAQPDRAAAIEAAREGAVRAHVGAMELLAGWLQDSDDPQAVLEGRMWSREAESWSEVADLRARADARPKRGGAGKGAAAGKGAGGGSAVARENARLKRELRQARRTARRVERSPEYRVGVKLRPLLSLRRRVLALRKSS